ncbi:MAG TPA: DUF4920 domain-containing protein [Planctomycetota bacterium]|nr:DUF4920 domain-containing protein [Planctomycetota bacterium]
MRAMLPIPTLSLVLATSVLAQAPTPTNPATPQPATRTEQAQDTATRPTKLDENLYDHFGDGIVQGPVTELTDALKNPDQFTGKTVRLQAPITAVCQTKGCWMHLGSQTPPVLVKFKDYGFFVPKDASGRTAIVEGTMTMKQETVEQTKHYLEDAGKSEEAAKVTEGRKLYQFVASGVAIKKAGS